MPLAINMNAEALKSLFSNPIFLSCVSSACIAQLLKALIFALSGRSRGKTRELIEISIWRTGGMPSSHAALVAAMTTSIAFAEIKIEAFPSNLFIFSLFVMLIIMRDALGVRRSSGLQARALNNLGKQVAEKEDVKFSPVKEIHGHTPLEVVVGALLGIFIAAGFALL